MTDELLRYPVGKFKAPASYTSEDLQHWIATIKTFPGKLRHSIISLNEKQLDTPYRPGGWTIRQVVHHVADSHMNSLLRFKWTLTEEKPTIKPYEEGDWALLPDYRLPVEPSLKIIEGIHQHWTALLESFTENEWSRTYVHPQSGDTVSLKKLWVYTTGTAGIIWHTLPKPLKTSENKSYLYSYMIKFPVCRSSNVSCLTKIFF